MNRRSFLTKSALALFGFSVLPTAKTYERIWKTQRTPSFIINPAWETAPFESAVLFQNGIYQEVSYPMRYVLENGVFRSVAPFITLDTSGHKA